jgi:hypothetical protein
MTPGLCLDTGEFIPASELNMSEKTKPELTQWDHAGAHYMHTEYEMRQAIEPLQKRIAEQRTELIALTGDNERLQRRIADLEAQLAGIKKVNKHYSDHCNVIANEHMQYQRRIALLEAQLASRQEPVSASPMNKRRVSDAIRGAYDLGYSDARNAQSIPGDSAPGYKGRDVEADHGSALINALYPAPAQQPLTLREIAAAIRTFADDAINIARAVEAEHGIKEKP